MLLNFLLFILLFVNIQAPSHCPHNSTSSLIPSMAELSDRKAATIPAHKISIIVPTYKEALNIPLLTERLADSLKPENIYFEVIFVDDNSQDGSEEAVEKLYQEGYDAKIIVRKNERGLSSAVLRGFEEAKYETLVVMDADLQHDPIYVPALIAPIISGEADFSLGSRNIAGGVVEDWPIHRKIISWGATMVAKPLVKCSDPMSGFFSLRKATLQKATVLNPLGYKIGLELMVRCGCEKIFELPIQFKDRALGESKLTMKQNILYLMHVSNLYLDCQPKYIAVCAIVLLITLILFAKKFVL